MLINRAFIEEREKRIDLGPHYFELVKATEKNILEGNFSRHG